MKNLIFVSLLLVGTFFLSFSNAGLASNNIALEETPVATSELLSPQEDGRNVVVVVTTNKKRRILVVVVVV